MKATHCWQVDGAWRVGFVVDSMIAQNAYVWHGERLMQHYHTGKIEAVPVAWLKELPKEIPTP